MTETLTFACSICGEASASICVYCTKDACPNHLCDRCRRCSDCCECDIRLEEHSEEPVIPDGEPGAGFMTSGDGIRDFDAPSWNGTFAGPDAPEPPAAAPENEAAVSETDAEAQLAAAFEIEAQDAVPETEATAPPTVEPAAEGAPSDPPDSAHGPTSPEQEHHE